MDINNGTIIQHGTYLTYTPQTINTVYLPISFLTNFCVTFTLWGNGQDPYNCNVLTHLTSSSLNSFNWITYNYTAAISIQYICIGS